VPIIEKLQQGRCAMRKVKATLKEPFVKRAKKAEFTACNISLEKGRYYVDFEGKKVGSSAILTNMLGNVALLTTSEDDTSKEVGDEVSVLLFG
jgi:molybdopterin molybdotransferase